jgi:hypothetical protein
VSTDRWRDWSIILKMDAPLGGRERVTGEQREIESDVLGRLDDVGDALRGQPRADLPPFLIEQNTGPLVMPAASRHAFRASTGHAIEPRTMAIVAPPLKVINIAQTAPINARSLPVIGNARHGTSHTGEVKCQTLMSSGGMPRKRCFRLANPKPTTIDRRNSTLRTHGRKRLRSEETKATTYCPPSGRAL